MSVRKREWITRKGEAREAWIVAYSANGSRHIETFKRKKDADAREAEVTVNVDKGIHTATSKSVTVAQAAEDWLGYVGGEGRERSTVERYEQLVRLHIIPRLGNEKLAKLTTPRINAFRDDLLKAISRPTARKVLAALKGLLKDAKRRGNVAQNVASDVSIKISQRDRLKLEVGKNIPTRDEIQRIIDAAEPGKGRALLLTAALTGMRASELRGLRWSDVDLNKRLIHVRQRADHWRKIGQPKSAAGARTNSDWRYGFKHAAGMEAAMSERVREPRVPDPRRHSRIPRQRRAAVCTAATGRRRGGRWQGEGEVRDARASPFLCVVVHQSEGRWRP